MAKTKKPKPADDRLMVAGNPRARHDYHVIESIEAGMVLTGSEVKSLRQGKASLREAFAVISDDEVFLVGMNIPPYAQAGYAPHEPTRKRKLLLHRAQIEKWRAKTAERGLTIVPLACYFRNGVAKVEIGLAKGKRTYDKRESIKSKDMARDVERESSRRGRG